MSQRVRLKSVLFAAIAAVPHSQGGGFRAYDDTTFVWIGPGADTPEEAMGIAQDEAKAMRCDLDICTVVRKCPPQLKRGGGL